MDEDGRHPFRMAPSVVNETVRRLARAVGDHQPYTAHSLRSGLATAAAMHGAGMHDIKRQTGHRSLDSVEHYVQEGRGFEDNVVHLLTGL